MPPWARGWVGASGSPPPPYLHQGASSVSLPNASQKPFSVFFLRAQRGWPFSSPFPFPPLALRTRSRPLAGTHLPGTPSRGASCSFFHAFNYCCKLKRRASGGRRTSPRRGWRSWRWRSWLHSQGHPSHQSPERGSGVMEMRRELFPWRYPGVHPARGPTVGIVPRPCPPRLLSRGERGARGSPGEQIC